MTKTEEWSQLVWAGWSRRGFLRGVAATTLLAGCGSDDGAGTTAPTPDGGVEGGVDAEFDAASDVGVDATVSEDVPFGVWKQVREALRTSPDHLSFEAERVVATGDAEQIFAFVRDRFATVPADANAMGSLARRRWGLRGTLRSGSGTLRDKAELLVDLFRRAGFTAEVQEVRTPDDDEFVARVLGFEPEIPFAPKVQEEDLARWRSLLGMSASPAPVEVIDPLHERAAFLATSVMSVLPTDVEAPTFSFSKPAYMPIVAVQVGGQTRFANVAEPGIALGDVGSTYEPRATSDPDPLPEVRVRLSMVTTARPKEAIELAYAAWPLDDVVGRQVSLAMVPPEDIRTLLQMRFGDVRTFLPVLAVQGGDMMQEQREKLTVAGKAVNIHGDLYEVDDQGTVLLQGRPISTEPADPSLMAKVSTVSVEVSAKSYPDIRVRASVLDDVGQPVQGLPASAFALREEAAAQNFSLLENRSPAPRVLFILDQSTSLPPEFVGAGSASLLRGIAESLLVDEPSASFRVLMVGGNANQGEWTSDPAVLEQAALTQSSFGSGLWNALASASPLDPTTVVMITDGAATDEPGVEQQAAIARLPPSVYVAVGEGPFDELEGMVQITGGQVVPVTQQSEAADAVLAMVRARRTGSYLLRYRAVELGPSERAVELTLATGGPSGQGSYQVPDVPDRVALPRVGGLLVDVEVPGFGTTRQVVAGVAEVPEDAPDRLFEDVHAAMFGSAELRIEGGAPTFSAALDDLITARLSMEKLWTALQDGDPDLVVDTFAEGIERCSAAALALHGKGAPAKDSSSPIGVRVVLTTAQPRYEEGLVRRISMTTLGSYRCAAQDRREAFEACMRVTARHAVVESDLFEVSTLGLLEGQPLVGLSPFALIGSHVDLTPEQSAAWRIALEGYSSGYRVVPAAGEPIAFWYVDPKTGALLGVLADGSGGGSAREELEQLEGRATSVINWVNATGGYFGILGLQAGVWLSLEKAKLKKLIAATIAIATMEAPGDVGDFSGVIGDVVCDAIKGVAGEALGSIGTNTASALVRALAATGKGILQADGFVEAGTGSAAINC